MAIENFLTYTEEDDNNKLTVTSSKAEGADVDADEDVYLYKDKGVDYFDALDVDFEIYIASTSLVNGESGIAVATTIGTIVDLASTDVSAFAFRLVAEYRIYLCRGNWVGTDHYVCSADTLYFCTLERAAGNSVVSLKIYSDAPRTNLLDTLMLAGFGTAKWQYIYGYINRNVGLGGRDFDGYVQNLDLKEVVIVGRSFGFIIG